MITINGDKANHEPASCLFGQQVSDDPNFSSASLSFQSRYDYEKRDDA